MYKTYGTPWDDDKTSLNSSFWSDGERQKEEEEVEEIERVIGKKESTPVGKTEDSYQEASEKIIGEEKSKPVSDAEDSYQEAIEEEDSSPAGDSEDFYPEASEEVEIKRVIGKEDSKPLGDAEDSYQETSEEEEEEEIGRVINEEESKLAGDSEDSCSETSEEEEEEIGRVISEEESNPVDDAEDSCSEASEEEESKPLGDAEDSYQETSEEEEEEIGQVISEEESNPVGDAEDSYQETSEEEEEEIGQVISKEESNPVGDAEDSYSEASEEEEEEIGQVISEEESNPVGDAEDSYQETSEEEESKPAGYSEDFYPEASEKEESKPVGDAEDPHKEASEEEKPELNNQVNISRDTLEGGSNCDDEESCSSSCDSPAQSLMTSGYGTYRPEEQEGGDYRDDHTITEFDQDSRGDLSEIRDDEDDDRSLCSFARFDVEATVPDYIETCPLSVLADAEPEANVARCANDDLHKEVDMTDMKPEEDKDQTDGKSEDVHAASDNEVTNATSEEQQYYNDVVEDNLDGNHLEGGCDDEGGKQCERLEEEVQDPKEEKDGEDKVESEESSSNKDIKFIDSKVDFRQMTLSKMCEWEGNLRQKKDAASCLEERLADLQLSSSAQRDFETEHEDVTSQSDTRTSETEGLSFSAFESYIRGMTRSHSDGDLRPKPKSFIRPVMSQQTLKKTDPVAKYFQYKQLWEMFKLPGEKDRRDLRWEIRERLAYQPPPPKPRRVYVPNTYIVPTEKKRSALRWEIRNDLANGLPPHKFSHRF
ncbi:ABC transporter F family member 4 isoform X3 [Sander lucioperca]|uniref:ABC transporter F family member 4 isoform X3 n=1 Tax=Sander lucioperca TaxID=283035 RepID=UPI00165378A2|nr:ABC transporter F family member 4 isoform X3 [Sander lucioperca]